MQDGPRDFAKAYVRLTVHVDYHALWQRLNVVRLVDEVLEARGLGSMADVTPAVLGAALALVADRCEKSTAIKVGSQLELLGGFLDEHGMTHVLTGTWRGSDPAPRPAAGEPSTCVEVERDVRLPTPQFVVALAAAFRLARTTKDILVSSVGAILSSAPERIGEVLDMAEDCRVEVDHDGKTYLALRWNGLKGAGQYLKWVPPTMIPVVERALSRLKIATAEGRAIKAWYDRNPTILYLPERLRHLRGKSLLTPEEAGALLGLRPGRPLNGYAIKHALTLVPAAKRTDSAGRRLSFDAVESHILAQLPASMRMAGGAGAHPLLLLEWRSSRRQDGVGCPCMFESLRYSTVRSAFNSCQGQPSIFQRLGLDSDGAVGGRTHSLRHFLCTIAEAGGLSQEDITEFRGGVNPYHNRAYDHVPDAYTRVALEGLAAGICAAAGGAP